MALGHILIMEIIDNRFMKKNKYMKLCKYHSSFILFYFRTMVNTLFPYISENLHSIFCIVYLVLKFFADKAETIFPVHIKRSFTQYTDRGKVGNANQGGEGRGQFLNRIVCPNFGHHTLNSDTMT